MVNRCKVIHNGCEVPQIRSKGTLRAELGLAGSSTLIVSVAGLVAIKGLDILIRAVVPLLADRGSDRHLMIVGDGPLRAELEQQARDLSVGSRVHFLGLRNDVSKVLADWDLFVLASRRESFSMPTIEAMAVGLPVVATAVGGVPEVVADGVTGLLVRPDDVIGLRAAISTILRDERLARTFGENSRDRSSRLFSIKRMVENHLTLYSELSHLCRMHGHAQTSDLV